MAIHSNFSIYLNIRAITLKRLAHSAVRALGFGRSILIFGAILAVLYYLYLVVSIDFQKIVYVLGVYALLSSYLFWRGKIDLQHNVLFGEKAMRYIFAEYFFWEIPTLIALVCFGKFWIVGLWIFLVLCGYFALLYPIKMGEKYHIPRLCLDKRDYRFQHVFQKLLWLYPFALYAGYQSVVAGNDTVVAVEISLIALFLTLTSVESPLEIMAYKNYRHRFLNLKIFVALLYFGVLALPLLALLVVFGGGFEAAHYFVAEALSLIFMVCANILVRRSEIVKTLVALVGMGLIVGSCMDFGAIGISASVIFMTYFMTQRYISTNITNTND